MSLAEEALALARPLDDPFRMALALYMLGTADEAEGRYDAAEARLEEALRMARAADRAFWEGLLLFHLGIVAWGKEDLARAGALMEEALAVQRGIGDAFGASLSVNYLGHIVRERGEFARAAELQLQALALWHEWGFKMGVTTALASLATLDAERGHAERAARWFGTADALRERLGQALRFPERARFERGMDTVRAALGAATADAAYAAGRAQPWEWVVAEALAGGAAEPAPSAIVPCRAVVDHGLTPRELDVLRLVAEGRTDREIADALFLSRRTVTSHLTAILTKLDAPSRTAAAAHALRHGLL